MSTRRLASTSRAKRPAICGVECPCSFETAWLCSRSRVQSGVCAVECLCSFLLFGADAIRVYMEEEWGGREKSGRVRSGENGGGGRERLFTVFTETLHTSTSLWVRPASRFVRRHALVASWMRMSAPLTCGTHRLGLLVSESMTSLRAVAGSQ